jgi:hypothetical protein
MGTAADKMTKVVNHDSSSIDYRLNILGIRIHEDSCSLIARSEQGWIPIGAPRDLPLKIPATADELSREGQDPLTLTAYQYRNEYPDEDFAEVLSRRKSISDILAAPPGEGAIS